MRSTVIIRKRGEGYISDVSGKFGGGHQGVRAGLTAEDAAITAAQLMVRYAQSNPGGRRSRRSGREYWRSCLSICNR